MKNLLASMICGALMVACLGTSIYRLADPAAVRVNKNETHGVKV
jgi:hypothetical protein